MLDLINRAKKRLCFGAVCRKLILSWLLAVLLEYAALPSELRDLSTLDCLANTSFFVVVLITVGGSVWLCLLSLFVKTEKLERWGILLVFFAVTMFALSSSSGRPFTIACGGLLVCFCVYAVGNGERLKALVRHKRFPLVVTVGLTVTFFVFVSAWTLGRVRAFCTPTYDFGIFSQMFYNMKVTGLPLTTLERDGLLSHFAVHVSPVYYLFLPVYFLFPRPETLQLLQAGVMASAVIPLWKLCRTRGFSEWISCIVCGTLIFFPAFSGGAGYDLHENCFLTPLILWIFYCLEKKRFVHALVFSLLTLCVKEDAAVYVCIIGLWYCVSLLLLPKDKERKKAFSFGAVMIALSLGWFFAVTAYLSAKGDGVMTYRYGNFMFGGSESLLTVVKAVIMNPMKVVYECVDSEKLKYIGLTMLPLAGIPLLTRRYERYILLIPYLLVNLMSDYQYQHDIFFQYGFGSTAFLMYLYVVYLGDIRSLKKQIIISAFTLILGAGCFLGVVAPKAIYYPKAAIEKREHYRNIRAHLDMVSEDASVAATTFYTTYLSSRREIYDVGYCSKEHLLTVDYIVVNPRDTGSLKKQTGTGDEVAFEDFEKMLAENGYERLCSYGTDVVIYERE